jgi:hypothetical protein
MPSTNPFTPDSSTGFSRRRALARGGALAGGLLAGSGGLAGVAGATPRHRRGKLPAKKIQEIVQAEGTVTDGVLSIDIARDDIGDVAGPLGVTLTPAFEIDGALTFQPLAGGHAFFNGDLPVKETEIDGFIDAILANRLVFQAFHQHYDRTEPRTWFIHWRGTGEALQLARRVRNVLGATSTPLPQTMPADPRTPLDADRLANILHGDAEIGEEGVVTVTVSRRGRIVIDGIVVSPEANISSNIEFKPLNATGSRAAAAPDFSMTAREVNPVMSVMRRQDWHVGCLYNQETGEHPQLYFSHMLKTGDPYALATEVRRGLDRTHAD